MLREISEFLTDYRFGESRYKRTKLISWLVALALQPSLQENGELKIRSTAKQIDYLLGQIRDQKHPRLADTETLTVLANHLHQCLEAHSACESWSPKFRDNKDGLKWQELQLVASLLGVFLAIVTVDSVADLLEEKSGEIIEYTESNLRPAKTQNKTQWGFIGKVSLGILEILGIDLEAVSSQFLASYGTDPIPTLQAALDHTEQS